MSKELFWAFFLFLCATSIFGKNPDLSQPVPDQEQQIDRMFDLTNRIRAERRLPILGLDARLCNAAAVHAEEMARYNYVSDRGHGIFGSNPGSRAWACGYAWSSIAETVSAGSSDVRSVLTSWLLPLIEPPIQLKRSANQRHVSESLGKIPKLFGRRT